MKTALGILSTIGGLVLLVFGTVAVVSRGRQRLRAARGRQLLVVLRMGLAIGAIMFVATAAPMVIGNLLEPGDEAVWSTAAAMLPLSFATGQAVVLLLWWTSRWGRSTRPTATMRPAT